MGWKYVNNDNVNVSTELLVKEWCWGRAAGAAEPGRRSGSSWLETGILTHCLDPGKRRGLLIEMEKLYWTLLFLTFFDASIMTSNVSSIDKNCAKKFFSAREYCMSFPFIYEVLYMVDSKCVTSSDSMRGRKIVTCFEVHCWICMLWQLLANLSIEGFIITSKLWMASLWPKNTNLCWKTINLTIFCQKCWEDLPDPITGLRGVPNRRACKGRGDHHTRGSHTWKGKRQDIKSTEYCYTVHNAGTNLYSGLL